MTNIYKLFLVFAMFCSSCFAQNIDLIDCVKGFGNTNMFFYNVEGVDVQREVFDVDLNEKNLNKIYKKYRIRKLKKDKKIVFDTNFLTCVKINKPKNGFVSVESYYIFCKKKGEIQLIKFAFLYEQDEALEKDFIQLLIEKSTLIQRYTSMNSIDFVNRDLKGCNSCRWMGVNNLQCPYNGQMSWSLHRTKRSAQAILNKMIKITRSKGGGKVVSEEKVAVIFEDKNTNATKLVYDFKGINSVLVGMSGGENLTIYYVVEKVRGVYASCILSYWNNDIITKTGLPTLLNKVMEIKK